MWLGGTKLKSLCEPSLSLCSRRGSRLLWLPSALSILSKEPLQPGPALISCRQTAACSGSAAPTELVTAARCTGAVCAEPAVSALCPLAATQVLPQGKPVTHRSCPAQQLNTEDTWKGLWTSWEPVGKRFFINLLLGHRWGEPRQGCVLCEAQWDVGLAGLAHSGVASHLARPAPCWGTCQSKAGADWCLRARQQETPRLWRVTMPEWDQRGKLLLALST